MSEMNTVTNKPLPAAPPANWYALAPLETAARLGVDPARGLGQDEIAARRARHGENRLAEKPPRSRWLAFADQFKSLLILVLIGAAALAGAIGDAKDAVVILLVVLVNALLGFWQEHRAEATLAALPIAVEVKEAIVGRTGPLAFFLEAVVAWEEARAEDCPPHWQRMGVDGEEVKELYLEAIRFAALLD
jgi:magnesium-transporting ATPase (P-type)